MVSLSIFGLIFTFSKQSKKNPYVLIFPSDISNNIILFSVESERRSGEVGGVKSHRQEPEDRQETEGGSAVDVRQPVSVHSGDHSAPDPTTSGVTSHNSTSQHSRHPTAAPGTASNNYRSVNQSRL